MANDSMFVEVWEASLRFDRLKSITFDLPRSLYDELCEICVQNQVSVGPLCRGVVTWFLDKYRSAAPSEEVTE